MEKDNVAVHIVISTEPENNSLRIHLERGGPVKITLVCVTPYEVVAHEGDDITLEFNE